MSPSTPVSEITDTEHVLMWNHEHGHSIFVVVFLVLGDCRSSPATHRGKVNTEEDAVLACLAYLTVNHR